MGRFYVYALLDPRTGEPFYIGKGCGNRLNHHWRNYKSGYIENGAKHLKINEIVKDGMKPVARKIECSLSESEALIIERHLIRYYGTMLTNKKRGQKSSAEYVIAKARDMLASISKSKQPDIAAITDWIAGELKAMESRAMAEIGQ